jgi:hypothetical protein
MPSQELAIAKGPMETSQNVHCGSLCLLGCFFSSLIFHIFVKFYNSEHDLALCHKESKTK